MKGFKYMFWIAIVALLALAACGQQEPDSTIETVVEEPGAANASGMDPVTQLALGTLKLEGTEDAVSVDQAAELLPLWRLLQSGALQGEAENAALVKQIEGKMTALQLTAIDGMNLKFEDTRAWMESPAAQALGIAIDAPGSGQVPGALQNMSEDERAKMRADLQNMSTEERATRVAEMGIQRPEGQEGSGRGIRPGGAGGAANALLGPLVELLTERSAG